MRATLIRAADGTGCVDFYVKLEIGGTVFDVAGPFDDELDAMAAGERAIDWAGAE